MAWYAYVGFLAASYVYHRLTAESPPRPTPASEVQVPKIDEGASYPLVYGRCRVRQPVLAWTSSAAATSHSLGFAYKMAFYVVIGIPFEKNISRLWKIWCGENEVPWQPHPQGGETNHAMGTPPASYSAPGGIADIGETSFYHNNPTGGTPGPQGNVGGFVQFFDGRATQLHVEATAPHAFRDYAGVLMKDTFGVDGSAIPGYRGFLSIIHFDFQAGFRWLLGDHPDLGGYSYEVSSYPNDSDAFNVGLEANPAKVLLDLLTTKFGKLSLPTSKVDLDSFAAAKIRLQEEGNGYSRAIDSANEAVEVLKEVCEQIDGVLSEDPSTGKIRIKLIRDDYDPNALLGVTTENCERLSLQAGGWENIVNKVRVVFNDRDRDYQESSASAHNQANAVGQDGETREVVLRFPGVCTQALANELAARELSARSRPISKARAIVDRSFANVLPGDPIRVTWPEYGIDGRVFRVAAANRGTLENGKIALDLIEDFFYVWRNVLIPGHPVGSFPGGGGVLEEP